MIPEPNYYPDHGIADLTDTETGMAARTMLPDPTRETASIQAYIGARFSRSNKSLIELAEETKVKGKAPERLEKIFEGYGHRSVGDQARIMVTLENIPDLEAMYILYLLPDYAAQQRSTRYQDFSNPHYLSPHNGADIFGEDRYQNLMRNALRRYRTLYEMICDSLQSKYPDAEQKTIEARALDEARSVLPTGIGTNLAIYTSARVLSEAIAQLRGSLFSVRQRIGDLLYHLLKGTYHESAEPDGPARILKRFFNRDKFYRPEAWRLIRHAYPKPKAEETRQRLRNAIPDNTASLEADNLVVNRSSPDQEIISRCFALKKPLRRELYGVPSAMGEIPYIFFSHDDKTPLGNIGQVGALRFDGLSDLGTLRDMNRHRSTERFIPFLETACNIETAIASDQFREPETTDIAPVYNDEIKAGILRALQWYKENKKLDEPTKLFEVDHFAKYLVPLGAKTRYFVSCSPEDLQYIAHLRTRPGGHLTYRRLVRSWVDVLAQQNDFYKPLLHSLPTIDPEEDFYRR